MDNSFLIIDDIVYVKPHVTYLLKLEALRHNTQGTTKSVLFTINDNMNGKCSFIGKDQNCKYYDCSPQLDVKEISSTSGKIAIKIQYENPLVKCSCDTQTRKCSENLDEDIENGLELHAVTRVTLFPKTHRSGNHFLNVR